MTGPSIARAKPAPLALGCALLFVAMLNLTLVVPGLKELVVGELGGTPADAALFFTVEMAAYVLLGPLWGLLSDRAGRRRPFVVAGFAAAGLLYLSLLGVASIPLLLALRFLQGGGAIAGWSTVMTRIFDDADPSNRSRRAGLAGAALILGVGTGAPLGGWLSHQVGPRAPLAVAGALFLLLAVAALGLHEPERLGHRVSAREVARALGSRPRLLLPAALYFIERFTVGLFVVVFPLFLEATRGADPAVRGRMLALYLFPFALGQLATYRLARRFGPLATVIVGTMLYGGALALLGHLPPGALPLWMVLLGLLAAVIFPPTLALTAAWSGEEARASALAAFNLAGSLGFALGPVAGTWAAAASGDAAAFELAGGIAFAGALATLAAARRLRAVPAA